MISRKIYIGILASVIGGLAFLLLSNPTSDTTLKTEPVAANATPASENPSSPPRSELPSASEASMEPVLEGQGPDQENLQEGPLGGPDQEKPRQVAPIGFEPDPEYLKKRKQFEREFPLQKGDSDAIRNQRALIKLERLNPDSQQFSIPEL